MNHLPRISPYLLSLALATGAVCAVPPAPAAAQVARGLGVSEPGKMGIPQPEPLVTLNLQNKSLARILYELFKQTPYQYRIPTSTGNTLFSLDVTRVPLTQALDKLVAQDKNGEPLVYYFTRSLAGGGAFTIDREYIEITDMDGDYRVSLTNGRLTKVLPILFDKMKVKFRIEPDVPPIPINIQLRPSRWDQALPLIILEAYKQEPTITYSLDGDTYVVHLQKTAAGVLAPNSAAVPARRVQVQLVDTPLRDALEQVLRGSAWKFQISPQVPDVRITYTANGEPEMSALRNVLRQASAKSKQVTYREGVNMLYIELGPLPGEQPVVIEKRPEELKTTSFSATKQRLREVVKLIAGATRSTVHVAPNVPDVAITFSAQGTIEQVMKALLESTRGVLPNLVFRREGGSKDNYVLELGDGGAAAGNN